MCVNISMKRKILKYNPKLIRIAKQLRNNATKAEVKLWQYLKGKQRFGYDFHRQKPIDEFIVDFYCNNLMLAIEIDGITHADKIEKDKLRQSKLESLGVHFLRFCDDEVMNNIEGVIMEIDEWIKKHTPSSPTT